MPAMRNSRVWAAGLAAVALSALPGVVLAGGTTGMTQLSVGASALTGNLPGNQTVQFVISGSCPDGWLGLTLWDMNRMAAPLEDHADPLLIWRQGAVPQVALTAEPKITLQSGTNGDIEGGHVWACENA